MRSYQMKNTLLRPKNEWGRSLEWEKGLWEGEESERVERDWEKWVRNCADPLYRNPWFSMDQKVSRVSRFKFRQIKLSRSYWEVSTAKWPRWIEKLSRIYRAYRNFLNGLRNCREVIKTNSQKPRWIEIVITTIERGSSRGSIDSLAIKRCPTAIEIAQK